MKNKSKLKKIKNHTKTNCPREWLYLNPAEVTPRQIAEVFEKEDRFAAQLWEEAGVVEIELGEHAKSIDMELTGSDLGDEYSNQYLKERNITSVYLVTIVPEDEQTAYEAKRRVTASLGGYFCGDTEDFTPVIK